MTNADLIARLRRMVAEPTTTVYSDAALLEYIKRFPVIDSDRLRPTEYGWEPTYDLYAAAQEIWDEKAAGIAMKFDFNADGGSYQEDQVYQHYLMQSRYYGARRRAQNRQTTKDVLSV